MDSIVAQSSNRSFRMELIFQETWNIKKNEKNERKTGDYSSFKITKFIFRKSLLYVTVKASDWKVPYQNMCLQF